MYYAAKKSSCVLKSNGGSWKRGAGDERSGGIVDRNEEGYTREADPKHAKALAEKEGISKSGRVCTPSEITTKMLIKS